MEDQCGIRHFDRPKQPGPTNWFCQNHNICKHNKLNKYSFRHAKQMYSTDNENILEYTHWCHNIGKSQVFLLHNKFAFISVVKSMSNISHQINICADFTHEIHSATALMQNVPHQAKENKTVLRCFDWETKIYNTFSQHYIHYWALLCGHKFGLGNTSGMIILMIFTPTARNCKTSAVFNTFHFQVTAKKQPPMHISACNCIANTL